MDREDKPRIIRMRLVLAIHLFATPRVARLDR
jgi:hypothetical protein